MQNTWVKWGYYDNNFIIHFILFAFHLTIRSLWSLVSKWSSKGPHNAPFLSRYRLVWYSELLYVFKCILVNITACLWPSVALTCWCAHWRTSGAKSWQLTHSQTGLSLSYCLAPINWCPSSTNHWLCRWRTCSLCGRATLSNWWGLRATLMSGCGHNQTLLSNRATVTPWWHPGLYSTTSKVYTEAAVTWQPSCCMMHRYYNYVMNSALSIPLSRLAAQSLTCGTVVMNMIVADITSKPPIRTSSNEEQQSATAPQINSYKDCLEKAVSFMGYDPFIHSHTVSRPFIQWLLRSICFKTLIIVWF